MKRFALFLIGLCSLLVALCAAIVIYGRAQPVPGALETMGFDLCDGVPCYKGMEPGITSWADTLASFKPTGNREDGGVLISVDNRGNLLWFTPSEDRVKLNNILYKPGVVQAYSAIAVSSLLQRYGPPQAVRLDGQNVWELHYRGMYAFVYIGRTERLDLNAQVMQLRLVAPRDDELDPCLDHPTSDMGISVCWRGFSAVDRYNR